MGTGPGAPTYLTPEAERIIKEAPMLVGWEFNFLGVKSLIAGKKIYLQDAKNYMQVAERAADDARKQCLNVAVLRIGDPCISSGLTGLLGIFHDFEVKIVPGISSIQIAASIAQINIDESVIISFHESGVEEKRRFMLDAFNRKRHLIVLTGPEQKPDETARYLISHGISRTAPTLLCENLTLEDEKIFRGTLAEVIPKQFSWLSVMVIICQPD